METCDLTSLNSKLPSKKTTWTRSFESITHIHLVSHDSGFTFAVADQWFLVKAYLTTTVEFPRPPTSERFPFHIVVSPGGNNVGPFTATFKMHTAILHCRRVHQNNISILIPSRKHECVTRAYKRSPVSLASLL